MAFYWNNTQTTTRTGFGNGFMIYTLKQTLVDGAGWLVKGSGNTSSYSNVATAGTTQATDYFDLGASCNNGSWVRLRSPDVMADGLYRELTFQITRWSSNFMGSGPFAGSDADHGADNRTVRVKYSRCVGGNGFYNGSITATSASTPSAETPSDEYVVIGSGPGTDTGSLTNGELGGGLLFFGPYDGDASKYVYRACVDDEDPYGFYVISYRRATRDFPSIIAYSPLITGSYDPSDEDPYIFITRGYQESFYQTLWGCRNFSGILGLGTGEQKMVELTKQTSIACGLGHMDGEENILPCRFYRDSTATAPRGWKGLTDFALDTTAINSRNLVDTYSFNTTRDKIFFTSQYYAPTVQIILPWDGSIPLT